MNDFRHKRLVTILLLFCTTAFYAQVEYPQKNTHYKVLYETEEQTDSYVVYSYILKNVCDENLMFYNFYVVSSESQYETYKSLPEDVIIIPPGVEKVFYKIKTHSKGPAVNWISNFMRYNSNSEHPVMNRDYVFFYEYTDYNTRYSYSYFLKNISDKPINFYDFTINKRNSEYKVYQDIPESMLAFRPGESKKIYSFSISKNQNAPTANWFSKFITDDESGYLSYQIQSFPFCDGVIALMKDAGDSFSTFIGPQKSSGDDLFGLVSNFSKAHIKDLHNEQFEDIIGLWSYTAKIGEKDDLTAIKERLMNYRNKLKQCLPSEISEKEITGDKLKYSVQKFNYEGTFNGITQSIQLKIPKDDDKDGLYELEFVINEPIF